MIVINYIWRVILPSILLITIYMVARILKTPFGGITIDSFGIWKDWEEQVDRDTSIFMVTALLLLGYVFFSWWWFIFAAGILLLNVIVFLVWMWLRSRKNDSDVGTEIKVLKGSWKSKIKR